MVKTTTCNFSGYKIYPGHGIRFIRIDSKVFVFIDAKSTSAFHQKKNPRKVAWTPIYRRLHKKGTVEEAQKRKARKVVKVERAIVGASLDVIRAKRNQKPEVRQASRDAALKEIKERKKVQKAKKEADKKKPAVAAGAKAPKPAKVKQTKQKPGKAGGR
eukprot:TRINITY_DN1152_c0_g1_i1.p1 TRINITY_DN1152_c0_g1~~TRINITY_DN1152_c0_g1_i1.p1  ORF type:complete len:159 (+),score=63.01 TRINITY_DN1152_c0_g1_i1:107-583(+)